MGRVRLTKSRVNLNEMLADLADSTTILGSEKNHVITYRHSDEELIVNGDHARLYQMFLNLLDNAVKYTPQGGAVSLTLHRDGDYAEIRVRDTGIGISPEDQKKIFDRFYRVDKARSRAQGGVGLGLAIVEWTVRAHDGQILVESDPGRGSTFVVRLPLVTEQHEKAAPVNGAAEERPHGIAGALDHLPRFLKRRPSERGAQDNGGRESEHAEHRNVDDDSD
jgi:signal transduction histidine kinase